MALTLHHANVLDWARDYTGPKFHALLCDPPYELGFMGKVWDKSGVPFRADTWAALAAHLHPGAFLMAFASSRGWHRQAVAMEDAGLVIHPTLFGWSFGSGFPKSTRVADASAFNGHRYGLQALKPALEPVIVAQVPYQGRPVDCITRTGAGALWVDGGRIETDDGDDSKRVRHNNGGVGDLTQWRMGKNARSSGGHVSGRWPANFYLADDAAAARLDEMSGTSSSAVRPPTGRDERGVPGYTVRRLDTQERGHNDTGGASRFFFRVAEQLDDADPVYYCAKASRRERDAGLDGMALRKVGNFDDDSYEWSQPGGHVPAAPRRNPHPTLKPLSLTRYLATLLLPPAEYGPRRLLVPFAGVGSECVGAMMAGWDEIEGVEMMNDEEHPYIDIARKRFDYWQAKHQPALLEVQP